MNRRDFLKDAAVAGLALRFGGTSLAGQRAAAGFPDLVQVEGESPAALTKEALAAIGGMGRFVGRGDRVVIKPNVGWDRTPEMAACTNPEVVKTLVELVLQAGAKKAVVIDNTTNQAKRCYVRSGIQAAVEAAGGDMLFVDEYRVKKMALKGEWLKEWEVLLDVVEADKLINVPIAKHHSLSRLTLGGKNWLGATGGARNQFHQSLDKTIVDLAAFFKPQLTVLDAYRILVRNGPQGGRVSDTELRKTVVAGTDPVAVDALGASFFGVAPAELPYLGLAQARGLGQTDLGKVRLEKERSRKYRALERLRVLSQAAFFGLFLYLLMGAHYTGEDYIGSTVQRFFHFDPLLALVTVVAGRLVYAYFAFALITVAATVLFGRVFCGWVCPLGAVHQFASFAFKRTKFLKPPREDKASLAPKYYILVAVLVGAVFGLDLAGYLDPLSFLTRSFSLAVLPSLAQALAALNGALYGLGATGLARTISQALTSWTIHTTFVQGFTVGLFFLAAVGLNARKERFWCRYLCPTGALLGLLSRWNLLKLRIDDEKCIKCGLCSQHCETQARPYPNEDWKSGECVYCLDCASICPTAAIGFRLSARPEKLTNVSNVALSRRRLLLTTLTSLVAVPFFRLTPSHKRASLKLIRPPGSLDEPKFLAKCVKCGQCMRACPTGGLQPARAEAGPEGLYTPMLVPKIGYCEYYCSLCTQVCPTGAITKLTIEEKNEVKMGSAWVNKSRCIPYVLGKPCIVCEEHCPVSPKAIKLVDVETKLPDGTTVVQKGPVIDLDLCIGCGICENKCPVMDDPAIFVTSVGETRSQTNRLLLDISSGVPGTAQDPY